jgi:hypothetical protein
VNDPFAAFHSIRIGDVFTIATPVDVEYVPQQGIDSFVGQLVGGGIQAYFDYGPYSVGFGGGATTVPVSVDGREAELITSDEVIAVRIPNAGPSHLGDTPNQLTVYASRAGARADVLDGMLRSVHLLQPGGSLRTISLNDAFTLVAPAEVNYVRVQGLDSYVGRLVGAGMDASFDFGIESGPFAERNGFTNRDVTVDGRPAQIATGDGVIGLFVPKTAPPSSPGHGASLSLLVRLRGASVETAEAMLLSVNFPDA